MASGNLLIAIDCTFSNGPWLLDEKLAKCSRLIKFSRCTQGDAFSVQLNGYHARRDSTVQIPVRAVQSGQIDRFGFIDDDVGGKTMRFGLVNGKLGSFQHRDKVSPRPNLSKPLKCGALHSRSRGRSGRADGLQTSHERP